MITGKTFENNSTYCIDIRGLFNALEITYKPKEWRVFIKAVLLHIGDIMPLFPVCYKWLNCAD